MEFDINNLPNMTEDELMHHGIRGMRWGVRRYQNKDGTLTAKGKKRYNEELAKVRQQEKVVKNKAAVKARLDRLTARQKAVDEKNKELDGEKKKLFGKKKAETEGEEQKQGSSGKKKVSEMSDVELAKAIQRAQMEKQYASLTAEEKVAKGDSFAKRFMKDSIEPAVKDAGKTLIRDKLIDVGKKKLGLSEKSADDGMAALNKEMKQLQLKQLRQKVEREAAAAVKRTAETPAAAEAKEEVKNFVESTVSNLKTSAVVNSSNVSSGKSYTTNKLSQDSDWQEFKQKYSWGVESYAMDEVVD